MRMGIVDMGEKITMSKRAIASWRMVLGVVVLAIASCGDGGGSGAESDGRILASVCGDNITDADLESELLLVPSHSRGPYLGVTGRQRLLEQVINRKLIRCESISLGLDQDKVLRKRLADFEERLLTEAWRSYLLENLPRATEQDLQDYYEARKGQFVIQARVNASWMLLATRDEAVEARKRVLQGEKFTAVAFDVNIDECTKKDGGLLGYFNPDGYMRCIGKNAEFNAKAFALEAEDMSEPFEWEEGWAVLRIHEKTTERPMPFRKAREQIEATLRPALNDSMVRAELDRLSGKFGVVNNYSAESELADKTADELMRLATESGNPTDKITYYEVLLKRFPRYDRSDEAQFMIGFVYSEELRNKDLAQAAFEKLLADYPDSQIRDSATYMLSNLDKLDVPNFETAAPTNADGPATP
jgi:parvulin-like peptidyl-prolyl isomerase